MKKMKESLLMLKENLGTLIGFELLFKLLSSLIIIPIFLGAFNLTMKYTGFNYLTLENIFLFLKTPQVILMLIVILILMSFYTMFDITAIIIILDESYQKQKIKISEVVWLSLRKCFRVLNPFNITLSFLVLFLIPFLSIGLTSSFISTIKIPEFILTYILSNKLFFTIFIIIVLFLIFMLLKWIYSLHYFVLENVNFREARKRSKKLSHHHHMKDLITIMSVQLALLLIYLLFIGIGVFIILFINKLGENIIILKAISATIIWLFIAVSFIAVTLLSTPISYTAISSLFYNRKKEQEENIIHLVKPPKSEKIKKEKHIVKKIIIVFSICSIIGGTFFTYGIYKGKYNLNIEYVRRVEVTAHRGLSSKYPENTISAFIGAVDAHADWIELDVTATKDNEIVVIHDTNLKRITGLDKNVWELTLDELKELDAGSHFNKRFKNESIPTLKEVIIFAQENNIKLNIELKPSGKEHNFEQNVINIITENDFIDNCVISSSHYELLENVKKINKDIKTVYVMSLAYGNIQDLESADIFSIEATNITKNLVSKIHNNGKEVYAWTINNEESIRSMIDLGVDNIITDNVTLAIKTVYGSKTSNLITEYIKIIQELFS